MAEDLVLDTAIRDWVLISLSVVMVLIGILRYFVSKLMRSSLYFLNLFGLRGLFSLILEDENAVDDTQRMLQMGGFGFDASKRQTNLNKAVSPMSTIAVSSFLESLMCFCKRARSAYK
ncbi:hypothetical protein CARUB_v10027389mg [Capsella rubella]|uniref:ER membrane protein complex subunit 3 n=1 Tax=Capsella rubella TaxID=81985 RepID=R0GC48_9BRAS|nr:hypothetical protein CARUB_v10027389mg [Capsella rubella]